MRSQLPLLQIQLVQVSWEEQVVLPVLCSPPWLLHPGSILLQEECVMELRLSLQIEKLQGSLRTKLGQEQL